MVGIIARDALGLFVATRVARFKNVFSPAHVKALAAREGLAMIVERGFSNSILECDSLQITIALRGSSSNTSFIRPVIEDVQALMSRITGVTTAHVHHQANVLAIPAQNLLCMIRFLGLGLRNLQTFWPTIL
ncbi:hypothetical protein ACFX2F_046590 [Malus domestica]|uniref:RNase H type-1 domain-containing protein n=1 Tax=Malus domestica TaxID=3750 RepID=A0A498J2X9_MALDO|nr:hypothetical protein DVH24_000273 [Malus domestica]